MSTQTRNQVQFGGVQYGNRNLQQPDVQNPVSSSTVNLAPLPDQGNFDEPSSSDTPANAGREVDAGDENLIEPNPWVDKFHLKYQPIVRDAEPMCLYEPLQMCTAGGLYFGHCKFHSEFMFNVTYVEEPDYIAKSTGETQYIKQIRKFIKNPMPFDSKMLRIIPFPELFATYEEFVKAIRLDCLAFNVKRSKTYSRDDSIIAKHKAYLREFFSPNPSSIVGLARDRWLLYSANQLNSIDFEGRITVMDPPTRLKRQNEAAINGEDIPMDIDMDMDGTQSSNKLIRQLDLRKCSIFTQMIILMYDTPYVIATPLKNSWLSATSAFEILEGKQLVLNYIKATRGTLVQGNSVIAYGNYATCAYYRTDSGPNILILYEGYAPQGEICLLNRVNVDNLLGIEQPSPQKN